MREETSVFAKHSKALTSDRGMGLWNALYYLFKPFLPQAVRHTMRRLRANRVLRTCRDWPVMESAGEVPPGWTGWPDGKKFALVLTHDVEGPKGYERCLRLAEIEAELGFRSSFNLIPEGGYRVTRAFRDALAMAGFEVGVHDLRHDGSLYRSGRSFDEAVPFINHHLADWGASGFRSGFMFHNLEWLAKLDIDYDASTFDTDPFEPQPDGVGTIFPFFVPTDRPNGGYVELPYTLPQDITMYVILREASNRIWRQKTRWIASRGGMVLLNVHPDYLALDDAKPDIGEFDAEIYFDYLRGVRDRYKDEYWNPLPRDLARYVREWHRSHLI
jgi:hypothetical protein